MGFAGDYEVSSTACLYRDIIRQQFDHLNLSLFYKHAQVLSFVYMSFISINNHRGFFFFSSSSFTTGRYNRAYPGTVTQLFSHGAATNLSSWRRASASYSRWLSYFFFLMCLWYNYLTHRLVRVAHFPPPPWPVPSMPVAAAWKCWHMRLGNTLSGLTGWHTLTPDNESYLRLERESLRTCGLVKI